MHRPVEGGGNTGEKTSDLREPNEEVLSDPDLLSSVEGRLANLGEMTRTERGNRLNPAAEPEDAKPESDTPTDEEKSHVDSSKNGSVDQSHDSDSSTLGKDTGVKGAEKEVGTEAGDDKPGLPDAYVRAAEAYGWKKEDVLAEFEANPDRAMKTFSNIYQTRNKTTAEFAAIGRRQKQEVAVRSQETERPKFTPVDVNALKARYGDEAGPLIEMIDAQNKAMGQLFEAMPGSVKKDSAQQPAQPRVFASPIDESGIEQQIHSFFEADKLKPYEPLYGKLEFGQTWNDLTRGQQDNRWRVLQEADLIAGGAKLQGVNMPLDEAMERAHSFVTQKYRDKVLVDGVKAKVVQRAKGITLQPSKGTNKSENSNLSSAKPGTRSKEQLVEDTQRRLDRLYGD
jgi:hypothetical protein